MTPVESYKDKKATIDQLLERITRGLQEHEARQKREPQSWLFKGDLEMIESRLAEVLGALGGLSDEEMATYRL